MNTNTGNNDVIIKQRIKKYELNTTGHQNIDIGGNMPAILAVREQKGKLVMWVQLEENYPGTFNIDINIVETDEPLVTQGKYLDTVVMPTGKELHVYAKSNYIRAAE